MKRPDGRARSRDSCPTETHRLIYSIDRASRPTSPTEVSLPSSRRSIIRGSDYVTRLRFSATRRFVAPNVYTWLQPRENVPLFADLGWSSASRWSRTRDLSHAWCIAIDISRGPWRVEFLNLDPHSRVVRQKSLSEFCINRERTGKDSPDAMQYTPRYYIPIEITRSREVRDLICDDSSRI